MSRSQEGSPSIDQGRDTKTRPRRTPPQLLPPWKVLLHNDDVNDQDYVVNQIVRITPLTSPEATSRMVEADRTGLSLLLTTHRERAELYVSQFASQNLTVTIEPGD